MPRKLQINIGDKFNRLTVKAFLKPLRGHRRLKMLCDCGNTKIINVGSLKSTKSCGCLRRELATTHGYTNHPLYLVWRNIINRCYNVDTEFYENYGGRGIKVCKEWRTDAGSFVEWSINNGWKKGLDIDRENNNGNYSPSNCRFVSRKINCRNRRSNIIYTTKKGEKIPLVEAVERYGKVSYDTAWARISRGWVIEKAVKTPLTR